MEISPISGIRAIPVAKVPPPDSDLSRVFDIENPAKPNDDSYSGSNKKPARGQDDEPDGEEEAFASDPTPQPTENGPALKINFFA